ncbi:hypothetical protein TVAG_067030 [Trichomonas vaginalis G3]|uniref:Uncharacterized protein n=1 Tax=Trichomonas vaginalis (strain ATCC PRA-98 / G3) TaxID=412133 RepID=A2DSB9_TRIV3|nr:porin domain-containing protein [Trichomonas vaginalis G3]EAY16698.1 hypothetical protein TVAG_067030 [Trichomonas vaginalis G3]KAI5543124.1 porin domain-containing protein [Trichomonas vaginalis G3]|eukprot:XP_001328921.1 hypothetical protein [Trichomonas vaginalis G3]
MISSLVNKQNQLFQSEIVRSGSVSIPFYNSVIKATFDSSKNGQLFGKVQTTMNYPKSKYIIEAYSYDEPMRVIVKSLQLIPNLTTTALLSFNPSAASMAKAVYVHNLNYMLIKQKFSLDYQKNDEGENPVSFTSATKITNSLYSLNIDLFNNFNLFQVNFLSRKFLNIGGSFTYDFTRKLLCDGSYIFSYDSPKFLLSTSGRLVVGEVDLTMIAQLTKRTKAGFSLKAEHIGIDPDSKWKDADYTCSAAAKIMIDDDAYFRAIVSSNLTSVLELTVNCPDFLKLKFSANSAIKESKLQNNFGIDIGFDLAHFTH